MKSTIGSGLLFLVTTFFTVWSFLVADAKGFEQPAFARVFFWHFPCAMYCGILISVGAFFSIRYLQTKDRIWDVRSEAVHELALILILLTMMTGVFFSKLQWGEWWQKDPRQESFLLVVLTYLALFVLRSAFPDRDKRALTSAGFATFAVAPSLFMIWIFPRLPQIVKTSFHPTTSIFSGGIKGQYAYVIIGVLAVVAVIIYRAYQVRVRAGLLEYKVEQLNGKMENNCGDSAGPSVVRPVPLSHES